jgi:signal transduction histidine kinase
MRQLGRAMHWPQTTVRWRLTLLYGGLFLVSGAALLAVTYTLVYNATVNSPGNNAQAFISAPNRLTRLPRSGGAGSALGDVKSLPPIPKALARVLKTRPARAAIVDFSAGQRISDLNSLEEESAIALAIMALLSGWLGWWIAGRVLTPLRTITAATHEISEASLDRRLSMHGPRDELRRLADTIDGLLERLEGAFDAQRRFVANASHELRTPLSSARALLEMILSDPDATVETFRTTCAQVLEEGEHQERLIDSLLALAQGQRGVRERERIDLGAVAAAVVRDQQLEAAGRGLRVSVSTAPAFVSGEPRLVTRLVCNLVENAIRHNVDGGSLKVTVAQRDGHATLSVVNSGQLVPAAELPRLLQPFQRLAPDRIGTSDGLGLGLSIVAAIADAHGAALDVKAAPGGGLDVRVGFPVAAEVEPAASAASVPVAARPPDSAPVTG